MSWYVDASIRLGRNLKHLVTLLEEPAALGIALVSLNEGIDATTPAGKLQMHILTAIAEFERARIGACEGRPAARQGSREASWQITEARPAIVVPGGSVRESVRARACRIQPPAAGSMLAGCRLRP
jgi:Resolvase, N terminal domain